jgi:hypothetical protein
MLSKSTHLLHLHAVPPTDPEEETILHHAPAHTNDPPQQGVYATGCTALASREQQMEIIGVEQEQQHRRMRLRRQRRSERLANLASE